MPPVPAVAPSDDVAVILQWATLGGLIGSAVAARRRRRDPGADAWAITTRWSIAGGLAGAVILIVLRLP